MSNSLPENINENFAPDVIEFFTFCNQKTVDFARGFTTPGDHGDNYYENYLKKHSGLIIVNWEERTVCIQEAGSSYGAEIKTLSFEEFIDYNNRELFVFRLQDEEKVPPIPAEYSAVYELKEIVNEQIGLEVCVDETNEITRLVAKQRIKIIEIADDPDHASILDGNTGEVIGKSKVGEVLEFMKCGFVKAVAVVDKGNKLDTKNSLSSKEKSHTERRSGHSRKSRRQLNRPSEAALPQ